LHFYLYITMMLRLYFNILFLLSILSCSPTELVHIFPPQKVDSDNLGTVSGQVTDISNNAPLDGSIVTLSSGNYTFSSVSGLFTITKVPPGVWNLTVSLPNYTSFITDIIVLARQTNLISPALCLTDTTIQICTYNLKDLLAIETYGYLAQWVSNFLPDILVFQEIQPSDILLLNQALSNAGQFYASTKISSLSGYPDDYLAVWSKWPVSQISNIYYPSYTDPVTTNIMSLNGLRPVLKFTIVLPGNHPVWFYVAHLKAEDSFPSSIQKRCAQAKIISDTINACHDVFVDQVIVLGDMNTALSADFEPGKTLDILCLRDDNPSNTSNDFIPMNYTYLPPDTWTIEGYASILDHIILSPSLLPNYISNSVKVQIPIPNPSDHYPVSLTIGY